MERRNSTLSDASKHISTHTVGDWLWVYNTAATFRQGAKSSTDAKVLKALLSLNSTGNFKILAIGPSSSDLPPGGRLLTARLLYFGLPNGMPGADVHYLLRLDSPLQTLRQSTQHKRPSPIPSPWTDVIRPY